MGFHTHDRGVYGDISPEECIKKLGLRPWAFTPTIGVSIDVFHQRSVLRNETFTPMIVVSMNPSHWKSVLINETFTQL